jgi:hypothetical protein
LATCRIGRCRKGHEVRQQEFQLAVDIVREIGGNLLKAARRLLLLAMPISFEQKGREGQRRNEETSAEQEQQQGNPEAFPRGGVIANGQRCGLFVARWRRPIAVSAQPPHAPVLPRQ